MNSLDSCLNTLTKEENNMSFYAQQPGVEFRSTGIDGVEIGNNGVVTFENRRTGERIFTIGSEANGYYRFSWRDDAGKVKAEFVHRMVAKAFITNDAKHEMVLHKNDLKWDNRVENLYWGDRYMNALDMKRNGIKPNSGRRPLNLKTAEEMRGLREEGISTYQLASLFNCSRRLVQKVLKNEVWV